MIAAQSVIKMAHEKKQVNYWLSHYFTGRAQLGIEHNAS